jgi:tetratricopeptide (TPR) repeat protein
VEAAAAAAVKESQQLAYLPLLARAYLVQGFDLIIRGEVGRAIPLLEQAATTAIDAGDEVVFVEAYARELFGIATTSQAQLPANAIAAVGAIPYVEHIARRLGVLASFERPLLFNNIGMSRLSAGDKAGAKVWFEKALEEPRTREGDIELVSAVGNLALVVEDQAVRERLFVRERETLIALLGGNHLRTLDAMFKSAVFSTRPEVAASQLREVCTRIQRFHAAEAADMLSRCAYDLGWLADERGDIAETRTSMQLVSDGKRKPIALAYLAALDGNLDDAIRLAHRATDGLQNEWWDKLFAGDALLFAAISADRLHRRAEAIATLRAALTTYDQLTVIKQAPFYLRRLARTKALLSRLLASSDRAEASKLAAEAAAWYRTAGGYDAIAGELEAMVVSKR